jgi:hypothetical protein
MGSSVPVRQFVEQPVLQLWMAYNVLNKDSALEFTQGIGFILCYGLFRSGIDKAMPFLIF